MRKTREAYVENVEQYEIHKGGKSMEHMLPKACLLYTSGTTGASAATVQTTEVMVGMSEYTVTSTSPV